MHINDMNSEAKNIKIRAVIAQFFFEFFHSPFGGEGGQVIGI